MTGTGEPIVVDRNPVPPCHPSTGPVSETLPAAPKRNREFSAQMGKTGFMRGAAKEHYVIGRLLELGFVCARPCVDDGADIWVDTLSGIRKVQVKTAVPAHKQRYGWALTSHSRTFKMGHKGRRANHGKMLNHYRVKADVFVVVRPDYRAVWVVPTVDMTNKQYFGLKDGWLERWDLVGEPTMAAMVTPQEAQMDMLDGV